MKTILLIESEPANLVAEALVMRSFGYMVLEASSQDEVILACHSHSGAIHLVITGADVDDYNATEIVVQLQLLHPRIRALFVSEESVVELPDKQRLPCECASIQRPFRADKLAETIRELLSNPQDSTSSFP